MTPARAATAAAVVLALAGIIIGVVAVPWDAMVTPWASLDVTAIAAFTQAHVTTIAEYADAVWLPSLLAWLAGPTTAILVVANPRWRRRLCSLGPQGRPFLGDLVAVAALLVLARLSTLPWWLWASSVRRDAGLLIAPWWTEALRWIAESLAVVGLGAIAAAAGMAVVRRWPTHGWLAVVVAAMLVTATVSALAPLLQRVEGTRADPALTARVMAIADQLGVDVGNVTVIETADRSPALNANVSGWGPTRTVTLFDTVTADATGAEIDALVAHELVHVRENDVVLGTALAVVGTGVVVSLGFALAFTVPVRRRLDARTVADRPVLLLLVAVVMTGSVFGTIVAASMSRSIEARADREAVAATGDPSAYSDLMIRLAVTNKSTLEPPQWRYALFFTHPTPLQRLAALDAAN